MLSGYIGIVDVMGFDEGSPALQTAAWLPTAWTREIEDESSARGLESGRGLGAGKSAKCSPLLSLQHVWLGEMLTGDA